MALLEHRRDPATEQTAAGYPEIKSMNSRLAFNSTEIATLRILASQVAEIAHRPEMARKAVLWQRHNDLETDEPLVFIDPENGWNEIIRSDELRCEDPLARVWEMHLRKQIHWADELKDDRVVEASFDVPYSYSDTGWGVPLLKLGGDGQGSYIVKQAIEDYEEDFSKIHYPQIIMDWQESARLLELGHEVFDGILEVRQKGTWWWTLGMSWDYVNLRGLEDFMCDFLIEPEWMTRVFTLLSDGVLAKLDFLENNGLLPDNTGATYVGSGGFGFTKQIGINRPAGRPVTTMDMWGFVESQETVAVNPADYNEIIFPHHLKIAERFGLNCYGCCEPYDPRWQYVRKLPRLRRVSCSPWANWRTIPDYLGNQYIASIKPSPTPLASNVLDESEVRADCRRAATESLGGICEFIMKDNHTLGNNPTNASRWVKIMREELSRVYG
jgi:hypothetical protein